MGCTVRGVAESRTRLRPAGAWTAGDAPPWRHPVGSWVLARLDPGQPASPGCGGHGQNQRGSARLPSSQFFRKYLTPEERADLILVSMEALTDPSRHDVQAASRVLRMILKSSVPDIGKVAAPGTPGPKGDLGVLPFHSMLDLAVSLPTDWG